MSPNSIPAKWSPYLLSIARIIFGFLILRHGMEQVLGFPEASDSARTSVTGIVELIEFPAGILMILGLFTRPAALALSLGLAAEYFAGPALKGPWPFRNGGDPVIVSSFFFLFVAFTGAGAWGLDRLLRAKKNEPSQWSPYLLSILRIAAGLVFFQHGLEKLFGLAGARPEPALMTIRGVGGILELLGGPIMALGLFTRPVAFILSGEMAVAYFRSWAPRGFWQSFSGAGMEASILFCFLYLFFFAAGAGPLSLDALIKASRAKKTAKVPMETLQQSVPQR